MYNENNNHINIPDDFEAKIYITLHHGLSHLNELEAKSHYENYGFNENRIYIRGLFQKFFTKNIFYIN